MKKLFRTFVVCLTSVFIANFSSSQENKIHIYQDADLSSHSQSAKAIQLGIEVAFAEVDNQINGFEIAFKYLDHRGNVLRSKNNYKKFLNDPYSLVMFSGIHSPPLIKNREFINNNKALTLVPWAAGAAITRFPSSENWIFRLSLDDRYAASKLVNYSINNKQCKRPHLLLENTPWGDSNLINLSKALLVHNIESPSITRFNLNIKPNRAQVLIDSIIKQESDCVILVSTAIEGTTLINSMLNNQPDVRLPIISHWGITSGGFHKNINNEHQEGLSLHFIQTCFAFTNKYQSPLAKKVFNQLVKHTQGTIKKPEDLKSAVGFIHAYDLTKLLIQAMKNVELSNNQIENRNAVRLALENLKKPVQGLIKNYTQPFTVFNEKTNINAHEALNLNDFCMGYFGDMDEIRLINET